MRLNAIVNEKIQEALTGFVVLLKSSEVIMNRLTESGYKIPETLDEAIDTIGEIVFKEMEWSGEDVEDIDVAWDMLMDFINKVR